MRAPDGFDESLEPLPTGVSVRTDVRSEQDVITFFATRRAELTRRIPSFHRALRPAGSLWIVWPKNTAGVATDLCEATVREIGLSEGLSEQRVCTIDDCWSGIRFTQPCE